MQNKQGSDESRLALGVFIFSLTIFQGLTINLMPLLFGTVGETFQLNLRQQGQMQSFFLAGGMLGLLLSGFLTERIGARRSGMIAVGFITLGMLLLGIAGSYQQVLAAASLIGLGNMWILAAYSAVISVHFTDVRQRMFMFATAFFAASATVGSVSLGHLMEAVHNWQSIFVGFAAIASAWLLLVMLFAGRKLTVLDHSTLSVQPKSSEETVGTLRRLRNLLTTLFDGLLNRDAFWILVVLVVLDIVAAGNIIAWTAKFFQDEYGAGSDQAGMVISCSSAGVFVGRVVMGTFVSGRVGDRPLLGICYGAGILMYMLILIIPGYTLGLVLVFLNGAFIAAQAPTMYAITSAKFGRRAATAIPLIDAIGISCGFATPTLVGFLGDRYGLGTVLWFIPALGFLLVAIVFTWEFVDRHGKNSTTSDDNPSH